MNESKRRRIRNAVVAGEQDPRSIRVEGQDKPCPVCETSAWYGERTFPNEGEPTYWLCKWCGFRWEIGGGPENGELALPVYHYCSSDQLALTWHTIRKEQGERYPTKTWTCGCGETLRLCRSQRPFPRFSKVPELVELPGG